jgi:hypothetical protein
VAHVCSLLSGMKGVERSVRNGVGVKKASIIAFMGKRCDMRHRHVLVEITYCDEMT